MKITNEQKEILNRTAHRAANGFCCGGDSKDMQKLVKLGLMRSAGFTGFTTDEYFKLTNAGHEILKGLKNDKM